MRSDDRFKEGTKVRWPSTSGANHSGIVVADGDNAPDGLKEKLIVVKQIPNGEWPLVAIDRAAVKAVVA